ncbi:MAG: HAD-IA family hydrolase [Clostridiales bacterium]|nr:HAD-IA family hydrolase [Clostridiales bacterium]
MQYQAIIFDFDYTLGDSTEGIVVSANDALEKMGYPMASREAIRRTIGLSLPETYQVLTGDKEPEKGETFRRYFVEKADEVMTENSELYPDARNILAYLKENGVRVAIVTTKFDYRIEGILKKCQATEYVSKIVGGNNVSNPKPDPEGTLKVLADWGLAKNEVLYVGDSLVDAKTAQSAGVPFAAVTTGTTTKEDFLPYEKVGVFANLTELMTVL